MTWNIKRHNDGLYLYINLLDVENWANYFYDLKYGCRYDSLNYTQLTDLLYEAENSCCLKFGALTGQDEKINHDSKTEIKEYFDTLERPKYEIDYSECVWKKDGKIYKNKGV